MALLRQSQRSESVPTSQEAQAAFGEPQKQTSWREEMYGILGMHQESGAPLQIGLFFAIVNVILRVVIVYFAYFLVTTDWSWRSCDDNAATASSSSTAENRSECRSGCMLLHENNALVTCSLVTVVAWAAFLVCSAMLVFDVYIVLRLPISNNKRRKWMSHQPKLSRAFHLCEAICFLVFLLLLVLSVFVSIGLNANSVLKVKPFSSGLQSLLAVGCFSMISVFFYMFVDWCSVCDMPQMHLK